MATLDIRDQEEITEIKFDGGLDRIKWFDGELSFYDGEIDISLVTWSNFDNFIKACYKAKELAGK